MFARIMLSATCAVVLLAASAQAQDKPVRLRGTVEQVDGAVLTVKSRAGEIIIISTEDPAEIFELGTVH